MSRKAKSKRRYPADHIPPRIAAGLCKCEVCVAGRQPEVHHFTPSRVPQTCICGIHKDNPVHSVGEAPPCRRCGLHRDAGVHLDRGLGIVWHAYESVPGLVQVGIVPDTPQTRALVTRTLRWEFDSKVDDGVWNVYAHALARRHQLRCGDRRP